jgi:HEAT repeat protein
MDEARRQQSVDLCIEMLAEKSVHMRRTAAWELGSLGDRRATPHLVAALEDSDWECRHYVVMALGRLADPMTIPVLEALLAGDYLAEDGGGIAGAAPRKLADHLRDDILYAITCAAAAQATGE